MPGPAAQLEHPLARHVADELELGLGGDARAEDDVVGELGRRGVREGEAGPVRRRNGQDIGVCHGWKVWPGHRGRGGMAAHQHGCRVAPGEAPYAAAP